MAEQKTLPTGADVNDFLEKVTHPVRQQDGYVILEMMERITGQPSKMWGPSIIGYGCYHYKYDSGHEGDAMLIGFSPRKQNSVLYILTNFEGQNELLQQLGKHKTGKVCLYINKLADINLQVLETMITKAWDHVKHKNEHTSN